MWLRYDKYTGHGIQKTNTNNGDNYVLLPPEFESVADNNLRVSDDGTVSVSFEDQKNQFRTLNPSMSMHRVIKVTDTRYFAIYNSDTTVNYFNLIDCIADYAEMTGEYKILTCDRFGENYDWLTFETLADLKDTIKKIKAAYGCLINDYHTVEAYVSSKSLNELNQSDANLLIGSLSIDATQFDTPVE